MPIPERWQARRHDRTIFISRPIQTSSRDRSHTGHALVTTAVYAQPEQAAGTTEVVAFDPPTPNEAQDGICFAASIASTRTDAWRCSVGNRIYDPCFTATDTKSVVCGANPITGVPGFKLNLTKPLPTPNKASATQRPWLIQLTDGAVCNFATGASGLIGDERVNYYCSDKSVIVGDLKPGEVWEASRSVQEGNTFGQPAQVPVVVVWQ
jgi:hypothetical protein